MTQFETSVKNGISSLKEGKKLYQIEFELNKNLAKEEVNLIIAEIEKRWAKSLVIKSLIISGFALLLIFINFYFKKNDFFSVGIMALILLSNGWNIIKYLRR
jgi:hypothetical protein